MIVVLFASSFFSDGASEMFRLSGIAPILLGIFNMSYVFSKHIQTLQLHAFAFWLCELTKENPKNIV
jgi:hypothetical protein